jgi:hypothetical protein
VDVARVNTHDVQSMAVRAWTVTVPDRNRFEELSRDLWAAVDELEATFPDGRPVGDTDPNAPRYTVLITAIQDCRIALERGGYPAPEAILDPW